MEHKVSYDAFPEAAIALWIKTRLGDYQKYVTLASMAMDRDREVPPAALVKFSELAKVLDGSIINNGYGLEIRAGQPAARVRAIAIEEMQRASEQGLLDADSHYVPRD